VGVLGRAPPLGPTPPPTTTFSLPGKPSSTVENVYFFDLC
jgi:hypothetical protein